MQTGIQGLGGEAESLKQVTSYVHGRQSKGEVVEDAKGADI